MSQLRCRLCQRPRPAICAGWCLCGAEVWEPIPHEVPVGVRVQGLAGAPQLQPRPFSGPLAEALGGVVLGKTILVGGVPGAGKSTLCAELAARMARELDGLVYWLDAEMTRSLLAAIFERTGSPIDRIRRIPRRPDPEEGGTEKPIGWREALRAVPPDAVVVVVDSIQRWAPRVREQAALLDAIFGMTQTILAISHSTKRGEIAGPQANQHDGDAVVDVHPTHITATKSRWVLTPRTIQRPAASESKKPATSSKASAE